MTLDSRNPRRYLAANAVPHDNPSNAKQPPTTISHFVALVGSAASWAGWPSRTLIP